VPREATRAVSVGNAGNLAVGEPRLGTFASSIRATARAGWHNGVPRPRGGRIMPAQAAGLLC